MTVIVSARFALRPGTREEALRAIGANIPAVHAEPGCEVYAINAGAGDALLMIERWSDQAALDAHSAGPAMAALVAAVEPYFAEPPVIETWTPAPFGTARQGVVG